MAIAANQAEGAWQDAGKGPSQADVMRFDPNLDLLSIATTESVADVARALARLRDLSHPILRGRARVQRLRRT